jgi:hypothetical protein
VSGRHRKLDAVRPLGPRTEPGVVVWLAVVVAAQAESWCASPLVAHEWGVHVIRADGGEVEAPPLPSWFHRGEVPDTVVAEPVRDLPADSGIRTLPVVQLYAGPGWGPSVPLAIEVGFTGAEASSWFPQVDRRVDAARASTVAAVLGRTRLATERAARRPFGRDTTSLPPDPTKQLGWDQLKLSQGAEPSAPLAPAEQPWVEALRQVPHALWVERGAERDRFLFYEADTHAPPDVVLQRGDTWSPERPHYVARNTSDWAVHDLLIVADGKAWTAPTVPAGATAGFLLDQPLDREAVLDRLRARWTDPAGPPVDYRWREQDCVMMRDPAVPVENARGHRLYPPELDVVLGVWADRLLAADGVHLVYREDPAALDARMPLALYTDMFHFVELDRLGLVLVEGLALP